MEKKKKKTASSMYHFQILYILCTHAHTHAHMYVEKGNETEE